MEFSRYVTIPKEQKELKQLYHVLRELHEAHPDTDKTIDELEIGLYQSYPNMRVPEREACTSIINQLHEVEVRDEILQSLLSDARQRSVAQTLAIAALEVSEGTREFSELHSIYAEFDTTEKSLEVEANFVTDDLSILEKHTIRGEGLPWRLNCLNRSLGPLRPGDFGFIFARPESGKTTFLADQCTYMAQFTKRPIIWFNNEEQGAKVRLRTIQAALGITQDLIWKDRDNVQQKYREVTNGLLQIYDDAAIHRKDVESVIKKLNPSLVIFDQIDKIKGFDADRPDLVFGRIYQWARELAKRGCAVIGVCQSDGSGEGVKWLTMSHVAEAKTSKQGEADWIVGIGKSNEHGTEDIRFINISKNKLLGDENSDPNERHGRYEVFLRPQIARYEDLD